MKVVFAYVGLACMIAGLSGCPKGYRFEVDTSQPTVVDRALVDTVSNRTRRAVDSWGDELYPLVHAEVEPQRARLDILSGTSINDVTCRSLQPFLSFVHVSDSQLKEHSISLYGDLDESVYDQFASGSERHSDLEKNDDSALLVTVLGINALAAGKGVASDNPYDPCPVPMPPQFVIHTGDAVDAGMYSELYQFLSIMAQLEIPFYNVIGNHDVLFFGTFPADAMKGHNVVVPFVPIHDASRFMRGHSFEASKQDISIPYMARDAHRPTVRGEGGEALSLPRSVHYHGFDLTCPRRDGLLCDEAEGYYVLQMKALGHATEGRQYGVRLIVLNTAEITPKDKGEALSMRSRGNISQEQFRWLAQQLTQRGQEPEIILVAGHHPMSSFFGKQGERLEELLTAEPRVAAYLAGHTHVNEFRSHSREPGQAPLWEIIAGSTLGYPQFGLLVELLENTQDPATSFIRVRTFRQDLGDTVCPSGRDNEELACLAQRGRLGAQADTTDGAWRSDVQAVAAANGMLRFVIANDRGGR